MIPTMAEKMVEKPSGRSTGIRANETTLAALRRAATELSAATGTLLMSDNDRLAALVAHWDLTKREYYAVRDS